MISIEKSNFKNYSTVHSSAIIAYCKSHGKKFSYTKLNNSISRYFGTIISDLDGLLEASPETIFELKDHYDSLSAYKKKKVKETLNLIGLYNYFVKSDSPFEYSTGKTYNSAYLSSHLDIFTCPFCNENYTYAFDYRIKKQVRRTYDWDHVVPKKKYPFLAICFYNLVPCCKTCNQLKLEDLIEINPHMSFNPDFIFQYFIGSKSTKFIKDSNNLKLNLIISKSKVGSAVKNSLNLFSIHTRYNCQKEQIKDIINKKIIYNSSYWNTIKDKISNRHNVDQEFIKRTFFSVYFNPDNYFKRPFSKLTNDLTKSRK